MATYGNRPALYKPTDFGSQQKRLSSTPVATTEVRKEEEKVTFKIQQRPMLSTSDQKPPIMDNNKSVKILSESPATEKKGIHFKNDDEKPGGVAQKDIDKITKLKEFMARQQIGDNEASKSAPAVNITQSNGSRDDGSAIGKSNMPYAKPQVPVTTKIPTTTFVKTFTTEKTLISQGKVVNGEQNPPGIIPGILPGKPAIAIPSKPFKENKDPEIIREEKSGKGKGQREVAKDGKNKGGGRAAMNRNQKNIIKSSPGTARNKPVQNEKPGGKTNKANEGSQHTKQTTKPSTNMNNVGARPKIITSKAPMTNPRLPNEPHKNHNRPYDRSQKHTVNSYYSQANKIPGFPNNELPPWLPYAMNTMNMNSQSILGQPQGPRVEYTPKPVPALQEKNSDQPVMAVVSGPSSGQKKVVTVEATKDKSEQKKSLDFVKSFFDTDPEVQYHRKLNAEKRSTASAPVVSAPVASVPKEEQPVTKLHMNNHVNSHFSSHGDTHVTSHVNNYGNISHANSRLVNNSLNNNQVNSQSFVHSSPHIQGNHIPGAPGSHIPGTHIPGSMASSYSSGIYHHSNMSNMAHNALHPNPQSGHFQGSSTVSPVHMGANPTQLHPAISSHPSSLHHRQQTYDLYSQVNQINPLLTEPDRFIKYCSVMNTNYPY